jgi:Cu/Ag efflux pump CusA
VIIAIYFFLRSFRATMIPAIALPISVVGTFAGMYLCGHSIDNISLLALTLAVGFVVDDAIVMLENIVRHIEAGEKPMEAALKGSQGGRLHDRLHDAVAGRRVHSGAVHGRCRRPHVQRVRSGDQPSPS